MRRGDPDRDGGLTVGFGGVLRDSCAAIVSDDHVVGVCEQERATRQRGAGPDESGIPGAALDMLLQRHGMRRAQIRQVAIAESFQNVELSVPLVSLDHHLGHAAAAFLTSPFARAAVLVCDHETPGTTVWVGNGATVDRLDWPWNGPSLATIYSDCVQAIGFGGKGREQRLEALARLAPGARSRAVDALFSYNGDRVTTAEHWRSSLEELRGGDAISSVRTQELSAALQSRLGDMLLAVLADVRRVAGCESLCLGGTLFSNTFFSGVAKRSGLFDGVYIPVDPGDSGLAIGSALAAINTHLQVGPFVGPAWERQEIKATLDNCKLNYEWNSEDDIIESTVEALQKGHLVGWFQGAMESGRRALGARSILASPHTAHVLENLNGFLKQRPAWRGYALSGLEDEVAATFRDSTKAPYMECDFVPVDKALFKKVLPSARASVRVQTVGPEAPERFRRLLEAFRDSAGSSFLVNTSFNGFAEPIVCSPRDAIRVFFGTGIDMLVMDGFLLRK